MIPLRDNPEVDGSFSETVDPATKLLSYYVKRDVIGQLRRNIAQVR